MTISIQDIFQVSQNSVFHGGTTAAIATANATSDATCVALCAALKTALNAHVLVGSYGVHSVADSRQVTKSATGTATADCRVLISDLESIFALHAEDGALHLSPDHANVRAYSPINGDSTEIWKQANSLKTRINLHFASVLSSAS